MTGFHVEEPALHLNPNFSVFSLVGHALDLHALQNEVVPVAEKKQNHDEYVHRGKPQMATTEGNVVQGDKAVAGLSSVASKAAWMGGLNGYVDGGGDHHMCYAQASMTAPINDSSLSRVALKKAASMGGLNGYVDGGGDHHMCHAQASMTAPMNGFNLNRMVGFKGFVNSDTEYLSTFQDPTPVPTKGSSHMGRFIDHMGKRGSYINDLQASMEALTCESPPGDSPFWRFLPSNSEKHSMDLTSCDEFCMYEFKVRRCMRGRSHDWTECPYAHPGEKARRRDPRCFNYSGTACPDFRRGTCRKGDSCELSHGVFECWLHPARFRTQLCKDGKACKRRVCFFAHSPSQLRLVSPDSLNNDKFSLKVPLASTDAMAGYFEAPSKQPPLFTNQTATLRPGVTNRYGAIGVFNDLGSKSMANFPLDGLQNAMSPMSALRHSLEHSKRASLERDLENYANYNSYGHQSLAFEDLSTQDHSHGYYPVTNGLLFADHHGYESSQGCQSNSPHSSPLDNSTLKADASFRSQLAIANLKVSLDQLMSPTSTLVGHVFSPPPLSPPLSPAASPPMSPNSTPSNWNTALSRKIPSFAGYSLPYDAFMQSPTTGVDSLHVSAPPYVPNSNYGSSVHAITHGPSPLSINRNGVQAHDIDRLNAMQSAINIENECVQTPTMEANHQGDAMTHLVSMLQQLELKHAAMTDIKNRKRCPSLLQRMQSPKARLQGGHGVSWGGHCLSPHQRHEAEQGLGGDHNGNFTKEEIENPDFGWVNELVK